jgi:lipopolysaccharide transport system ATP-binding protein
MSSSYAIRAEGIAKVYEIGERERYKALRDTIAAGLNAPVRLAKSRGRRSNGNGKGQDHVWALKDISFEVEPGEVVGVIGRNGAGKSTLLKVVSRVTEPTRGTVDLWGRVGTLLEVGTGFHNELTGRENVYLSGAILGMNRHEVRRKFDEIVEFAEVQRFIDTPVKRYSSGMLMRLGFAVAAHLETEILLVDEVLAVGDAEFQQRCMGRIGSFAHEGRTVFFVSHNMGAINRLCPRTLFLSEGMIEEDGPTSQVISHYLRSAAGQGGERTWPDPATAPGNDRVRVQAVRVRSGGLVTSTVDIDQDVVVEIEYRIQEAGRKNLCASIHLYDGVGNVVLMTASTPGANALEEEWFGRQRPTGLYRSELTIPANLLNDGRYYVTVYIASFGPEVAEAYVPEAVGFDVLDTGAMRDAGGTSQWPGAVRPRLPWRTELLTKGSENSGDR